MRPRRSALLLCLLIIAAAASTVSAADPARIALSRALDPSGAIRLTARVTDASGAPVEGSPVTFRARTAFGWLVLSEVETDGQGTAVHTLPSDAVYAEISAQAGEADALRAGLVLARVTRPDPVVRPGGNLLRRLSPQPGLLSPYPPPQILFVAALLGGIWITYAYLLTLLIRIRRAR